MDPASPKAQPGTGGSEDGRRRGDADAAPLARWITRLPPHIRVAGGITACFTLVVVVLAWSIGGELRIPTERVSKVLGFSAVLPLGLAMAAYLVTQAGLIALGKREHSARHIARHLGNDLALLVLFVIVVYLHFNLKMWMPVINPALYDAQYMEIEERLRWLVDLLTWISTVMHAPLSEDVRWYQVIFLTMFIVAFCHFAVVRNEAYPRFVVGIVLVLSLGGLSYLIAPAVGPFIYENGNNPLATDAQAGMFYGFQRVQEEGMSWINRWGSAYFTGALAAMPSLHLAHATVITYYMVTSRAFLAPLFVLFWFWVLVDSIALRWHYIVDAPAGIILAVFVIWLTNRLLRDAAHDRPATDSGAALASRDLPARET